MKIRILPLILAIILLFGCRDNSEDLPAEPIKKPEVTTLFSFVVKTSAAMGGRITPDSASIITDCGITWSKFQYPDSSELIANMISAENVTETFYVTITGLVPNSDYFVWAYATNDAGTGYGEPILITTEFEPDKNLPVDPLYPATYYALDSVTLSEKRTAYAEKNKYMHYTLNEFGFCRIGDIPVENPPAIDSISEEDAINRVEDFVSKNRDETGITSIDSIAFKEIKECTVSAGVTSCWYLKIKNQTVNSIEVLNSTIGIRVRNGEVVHCAGNWYPDIYIPSNFNFDEEQAKSLLVGRVVMHYGFGGDAYYMKVSAVNANPGIVTQSIIPIGKTDRIELRITWQIYVQGVSYKFYVDVMTGEIVHKEPTIIS